MINKYRQKQVVCSGKTIDIVGVDRDSEPLHVDGGNSMIPSDYFSGFEDLLIMGGSRCVSHGMGSFGSFGYAVMLCQGNFAELYIESSIEAVCNVLIIELMST